MTTPLDRFFNAISMLSSSANELHDIASALSRVGMDRLAGEIEEIASGIKRDAIEARRAFTAEQKGIHDKNERMAGSIVSKLIENVTTLSTEPRGERKAEPR